MVEQRGLDPRPDDVNASYGARIQLADGLEQGPGTPARTSGTPRSGDVRVVAGVPTEDSAHRPCPRSDTRRRLRRPHPPCVSHQFLQAPDVHLRKPQQHQRQTVVPGRGEEHRGLAK